MTTKVVRGQLLTFSASPVDYTGGVVVPQSIKVYLNYPHADGVSSTDTAIDMDLQSDGTTWLAEFDTTYASPGAAFGSMRSEGPSAAEDFKFTITANAANPDSPST